MSHLIEDIGDRALDALYAGALFLTAGDVEDAADLLGDSLARTFAIPLSADADLHRRAEGGLAEAYLQRSSHAEISRRPPSGPPQPADPKLFELLPPEALYRAAGVLTPHARAALWLVMLRRWSYREAGEALDLSTDGLRELLTEREKLLTALLSEADREARRERGGAG